MSYRTFTNNHGVTLAKRIKQYLAMQFQKNMHPIERTAFVGKYEIVLDGLEMMEVITAEEAQELRVFLYENTPEVN